MPTRTPTASPENPTPLQIYLHDINGTPLLGADEEHDLAERVALGDPEARNHMVKANLRLVVNIARGYLGKGLGLEDLIEEGNLGLMRAVEGFDARMKTRFSTYASYWIKQSIRRAVMNNGNGKPIRLPAYMVSLLAKWRRAATALEERHGRPPTPEEVGAALRISKKKVDIVARAFQIINLTPHPDGGDDEGVGLDEMITDERYLTPDDQMIRSDSLERVFNHLEHLDPREANVVRMRFGLDPYPPMTLRQVGDELGLTRERVRQLENLALTKLIDMVDRDPAPLA